MKAETQRMRAKVVEAEAQYRRRSRKHSTQATSGVMDYYKLNNVKADTEAMRGAIGSTVAGDGQQAAGGDPPRQVTIPHDRR